MKVLVAAVGLELRMILKTKQLIDFIAWFWCGSCSLCRVLSQIKPKRIQDVLY